MNSNPDPNLALILTLTLIELKFRRDWVDILLNI